MTSSPKARIVMQQCLSARLQVEPPTDQKEGVFVEIGRGLILYVCFLKGANPDTVNKMVKEALNAKLSTAADGKLCSILDLPGDVLIIPQATLGGCLKGKSMQYHRNIGKEEGLELYKQFTLLCEETLQNNELSREAGRVVKWGTYGNIQVFRCDTNGPYSHLLEY